MLRNWECGLARIIQVNMLEKLSAFFQRFWDISGVGNFDFNRKCSYHCYIIRYFNQNIPFKTKFKSVMDINLKPFCHREPFYVVEDLLSFESFREIPEIPGVYILASSDQKFIYPNGQSRIIYIGKSEKLRARIKNHKKGITELSSISKGIRGEAWWYTRYQYLVKFGCRAYFFSPRGTQEAKNLENQLLGQFYYKYLALPVGNGAISFRKINQPFEKR